MLAWASVIGLPCSLFCLYSFFGMFVQALLSILFAQVVVLKSTRKGAGYKPVGQLKTTALCIDESGHQSETCLLAQACVQGRIDSTTAKLDKLRQHLEMAQYGDKSDGALPPPGTFTSDNPAAAAAVRSIL